MSLSSIPSSLRAEVHKSNKVSALDPMTGAELPLFHPLLQRWDEHFRIAEDGTCEGLTPVGRATVAALRMNDPLPKTARAMQRFANKPSDA